MNKQEYLNLIDDLNETIADNKFFENLGISFSFTTNGYIDVIEFGNFVLYNSENDSLSIFDDLSNQYIDITLKEFVSQKLVELSNEMFNMSQELIKIKDENR